MVQSALDRTVARRQKRRRALAAVLLTSSLATLGAGAISLAVFTDSEAADGSWTTGTIVLGVDAGTSFTADDILPGDTGEQTVTIENNGTGELRYALSTSATDDGAGLASQLDLVVSAGACGSGGAELYDGSLDGAALGDVAQGEQGGERVVAAGADDELCFAWSFPLSSGNSYQDSTTTATFTFDAEQTANNP